MDTSIEIGVFRQGVDLPAATAARLSDLGATENSRFCSRLRAWLAAHGLRLELRARAADIEQLRSPLSHHRSIRTTNLLERRFGAERCRDLRVGPFETKQLDAPRVELDDTHRRHVALTTTLA